MVHRVKKVKYLSEYKLALEFDNKKVKIVDLEGMLANAKNMFLQLVNIDYFKKVECDGYSICWPNGIDFCPDLLYKVGKDLSRPGKKRQLPSSKKTPSRKKRKSFA